MTESVIEMERQYALNTALASFSALQKQHLLFLDTGAAISEKEWEERQRLFQKLQHVWNESMPETWGDVHDSILNQIKGKVAALIENEMLLYEKAEFIRSRLKRKIGAVRKGKTAVQGYGQRNGMPASPRFLSSKG